MENKSYLSFFVMSGLVFAACQPQMLDLGYEPSESDDDSAVGDDDTGDDDSAVPDDDDVVDDDDSAVGDDDAGDDDISDDDDSAVPDDDDASDDDDTTPLVVDNDGDGYPDSDCNDSDPNVHPGATEVCGDGIDNDCDGDPLDEIPFTGYLDLDGDGFGLTPFAGCAFPSNGVAIGGDCDDSDDSVHPGALELCNGRDDNCDSVAANELDMDGDSFLGCEDCDDSDEDVHPGAPELCNGQDDNCDSVAVNELDMDGDSFLGCEDCDDQDDSVHPDAVEVCGNAIDEDCDGVVATCPLGPWSMTITVELQTSFMTIVPHVEVAYEEWQIGLGWNVVGLVPVTNADGWSATIALSGEPVAVRFNLDLIGSSVDWLCEGYMASAALQAGSSVMVAVDSGAVETSVSLASDDVYSLAWVDVNGNPQSGCSAFLDFGG